MTEQTLTIQQAIDIAIKHHTAGELFKAENIYQQILQADPNQPIALHFLGVIAHQVNKNDVAVDLIGKALAINPDYAEAYSNLGITLQDQGKLDDAIASYNKAIGVKPDFTDAYFNLGNALQAQGKLDDAIASYNKAIAIKPDFTDAYFNLGNAFTAQEKLDDAVASYNKAIAINPDYANAHNNLGITLNSMNRQNEAFNCHRRAVTLDSENNLFWAGLAQSLRGLSFTSVDDGLWNLLSDFLERPTVYPASMVRPVISALQCHPGVLKVLELVNQRKESTSSVYADAASQLSEIPLLLQIMALTPLCELKIEEMLTSLRHAMLQEAMTGNIGEKSLPFTAALALQCFINEYIYSETEAETNNLKNLEEQVEATVKQNLDVEPTIIVALAAYRSLHTYPWSKALQDNQWQNAIKDVIIQQISEPLEEQSLRSRIICLTPIIDTVSSSVRQQYEENPYPRWVKADRFDQGRSIRSVLQGEPFNFDIGEHKLADNPEILIAGCGTGQHAINTASRFSNAHVLALDLSLSSLSYAKRKSEELGITNIEYAQADIMELANFGRNFDLIESGGVLHHLGDPLAGWRILVDLLRPNGFMKIGLYSETARECIVEGRSIISGKGYSAAPENIRRCRQEFMAMAKDGNKGISDIITYRDFFNLSEFRDLLFHVQEHKFTLPKISKALDSMNLKFLGFEMTDQKTNRKFKDFYPTKSALSSLTLWHEFELNNPDTFSGMYQFWCQKLD